MSDIIYPPEELYRLFLKNIPTYLSSYDIDTLSEPFDCYFEEQQSGVYTLIYAQMICSNNEKYLEEYEDEDDDLFGESEPKIYADLELLDNNKKYFVMFSSIILSSYSSAFLFKFFEKGLDSYVNSFRMQNPRKFVDLVIHKKFKIVDDHQIIREKNNETNSVFSSKTPSGFIKEIKYPIPDPFLKRIKNMVSKRYYQTAKVVLTIKYQFMQIVNKSLILVKGNNFDLKEIKVGQNIIYYASLALKDHIFNLFVVNRRAYILDTNVGEIESIHTFYKTILAKKYDIYKFETIFLGLNDIWGGICALATYFHEQMFLINIKYFAEFPKTIPIVFGNLKSITGGINDYIVDYSIYINHIKPKEFYNYINNEVAKNYLELSEKTKKTASYHTKYYLGLKYKNVESMIKNYHDFYQLDNFLDFYPIFTCSLEKNLREDDETIGNMYDNFVENMKENFYYILKDNYYVDGNKLISHGYDFEFEDMTRSEMLLAILLIGYNKGQNIKKEHLILMIDQLYDSVVEYFYA